MDIIQSRLAAPVLDDNAARAFVAALDGAARRVHTPCGEGEMVWRLWGEGPVLVLLHGGHGSWTHWVRNIADLAERFTILAPDMPGYGESSEPPHPYSAESLAEIVATGIGRMLAPSQRFALAGFSFGGIVGGHVARLTRERTERLVIVASGGLGLPRVPMRPLRSWRRLPTLAARQQAHRENLAILMIHDPARIDALAVHLQATNTARTHIDSPPIARTDTLVRCLHHVLAPLAGIWGEQDATAKSAIAARRDLLRSIDPDAEFEIIADAGHWAPYEQPATFNAALAAILACRRLRRRPETVR
jgi:2-hydroxy-6-oxonona-2,4-dienedioate hydrolase